MRSSLRSLVPLLLAAVLALAPPPAAAQAPPQCARVVTMTPNAPLSAQPADVRLYAASPAAWLPVYRVNARDSVCLGAAVPEGTKKWRALVVLADGTVNLAGPYASRAYAAEIVWKRSTATLPTPPVPPTVPPAVAVRDTVTNGYLVSRARAREAGGAFAAFDSIFDLWAERHYQEALASRGNPYDWEWTNYYGRDYAYYAACARGGPPVFCARGDAHALDNRRRYLHNGALDDPRDQPPPYMAMLDGLATHYFRTGDDSSRYTLVKVAAVLQAHETFRVRNHEAIVDGRHHGRQLLGAVYAARVGGHPAVRAPSYAPWAGDAMGWTDPSATWAQWVNWHVDQLTAHIDSAGRWDQGATACGGQQNFMVSIALDALMQAHDYVVTDPARKAAIVAAVKRASDYLRATQWHAGQGFNYADRAGPTCASVSAFDPATGVYSTWVARDLTGLMLEPFAWLYRRTGDARGQAFVREALPVAVAGGQPELQKQFNQLVTWLWRVFDVAAGP